MAYLHQSYFQHNDPEKPKEQPTFSSLKGGILQIAKFLRTHTTPSKKRSWDMHQTSLSNKIAKIAQILRSHKHYGKKI